MISFLARHKFFFGGLVVANVGLYLAVNGHPSVAAFVLGTLVGVLSGYADD